MERPAQCNADLNADLHQVAASFDLYESVISFPIAFTKVLGATSNHASSASIASTNRRSVTMDVEMREARPDSKSSHVHRRMMVEGDRDEMTLARMGKKQVLKVRHSTPGFMDTS